jgi:hypothetical protein
MVQNIFTLQMKEVISFLICSVAVNVFGQPTRVGPPAGLLGRD